MADRRRPRGEREQAGDERNEEAELRGPQVQRSVGDRRPDLAGKATALRPLRSLALAPGTARMVAAEQEAAAP